MNNCSRPCFRYGQTLPLPTSRIYTTPPIPGRTEACGTAKEPQSNTEMMLLRYTIITILFPTLLFSGDVMSSPVLTLVEEDEPMLAAECIFNGGHFHGRSPSPQHIITHCY
ncbi:hypothetical protein ACOMHN_059601 [Nucella lapillus]